MLAVLAETDSDVEVLVAIIRKLLENPRLPIKKKGFNNCSELKRKGARVMRMFAKAGVDRFIICHDADSPNPAGAFHQVESRIVKAAGLKTPACIIIPVEEIEAWLISDELAISRVIPTFKLRPENRPEGISSPKEWLERKSRGAGSKPKYIHNIHNQIVARHLRLDLVSQKCPSFRVLTKFVGK